MVGYIPGDDRIRSNLNVSPELHWTQDFGPRADVTVTAEFHRPGKSDLMKDKAVRADPGGGMYYDPRGMGQHETTLDMAVEVYFRLGDEGPEPVVQHPEFGDEDRIRRAALLRGLVSPN